MALSTTDTPKKSVTFANEDQNTCHIYDGRATDILWEVPAVFVKSREAARKHGKILKNGRFAELLEDCFCNTRSDVQKCLNEYVKVSGGRGIERFASRSMATERKEERSNAIKAIIIGQAQAREKGLSPEVVAEQLREVSLLFCLNAKVYARRMGKADEAACYSKKKSSSSGSSVKSYTAAHGKTKCTTHTANIIPARVA